MTEQSTISVYDAIRQMRILTAEGRFFSFSHSTLNKDTNATRGIRIVHRAKLRPAAKEDDVRNAQYKIFYFDMDQQKPRTAWQPLLMTFENKKVVL